MASRHDSYKYEQLTEIIKTEERLLPAASLLSLVISSAQRVGAEGSESGFPWELAGHLGFAAFTWGLFSASVLWSRCQAVAI